jgi:hypothetical protein
MSSLLSFGLLGTVKHINCRTGANIPATYPYLLRDVARLTTPAKSNAPRTSL